MNSNLETQNRRERWKKILKIAWPLIVANSFWNLQFTIDRIFLGNYSTESLGAAIAVMGLFWTPMALLQQTSSYVMTFVAQYTGAKEDHMIGPSVWQSLYIGLVGGLLMLCFIPFASTLFEWIGHDPSLRHLEVDYFKAICYSALPTAIVACASGFFTGLGDTKIIMWINFVGLLVNAILDYVMIFGHFGFPEMGIKGAGYATAIGNYASAFYGLYLVFNKKYEVLYKIRSGFHVHWDLMKRYVRYGIPSGLQWSLEGLAFTIFLVFVGRLNDGSAALASSGIVVTIMMLAILPVLGIAQAVQVLVGQKLGEKSPEEAEIYTWSGYQVGLIYIALMSATFLLFPNFYLGWFQGSSNTEMWGQVSTMVPYLLIFIAIFILFDCMTLMFSLALKGAGDTKFVTLIALLVPWPMMVLPTSLLSDQPNAIYLAWTSVTAYSITQAIIFWRRFVGGKWKKMSVIH
jgi:MATE family multidrug resistance protein